MVFVRAGISLLRERQGGFAVAPLTPSHCTLLLQVGHVYWKNERNTN
jgi:hypothetical protein